MRENKKFRFYELKNHGRERFQHRMNQITNTFWGKEYVPDYKRFCKRKVMGKAEVNLYMAQMIKNETPFCVGRFGHTELRFLYAYLRNKYHNIDPQNMLGAFSSLHINAGFFPEDITYGKRYVEMVLEASSQIDLLGIWPLKMEDYFVSQYMPQAALMRFIYLEPWAMLPNEMGVKPWSHALKGRKVLLIHPFTETIKKQYENKREFIFAKRFENADDILPRFELKTLQAVQTIAGTRDDRFNTWFEALDWMINECKKIDFDIAILGCGAYGFPLAVEIKKMGKGAIQMCGATQLMFGILGKRWENNTGIMNNLVNEFWTHPDESEKVENMINVEDACYW